MNIKTKTIFFILCALIISLFFYGVGKKSESEMHQKSVYSLEGQLNEYENNQIEYSKSLASIYRSFFFNQTFLNESIENKKSLLVYRFSKYMCEGCIQDDFMEIEKLQDEIGKEKILLLPAFPNDRSGRIELSNILAKFNYVNIPLESLIIPSFENNYLLRYFAVIDRDGNLSMVFFPRRDEAKMTRLYLSEVKKELLK